MRQQRWKLLLVLISMLAAGICYSCERNNQSEEILITEQPTETGEVFQPSETVTEVAFCYVHVCGEVQAPGVYELAAGERIYSAVEAAGGFTDQAAKDYLNMAETVSDGMKIFVPDLDSVEDGGPLPEAESGGAPPKVNINTASKEQLMTLKGIGEARAMDIINYRESQGKFERIEDIMEVSGIKDAAFQKIKDSITVK